MKRNIIYQDSALGLPPLPPPPQPYGAAGYEYTADLFGQPQSKPNVALQQFEQRTPPPFPPAPQGWRPDYPNLLKLPLPAAQQQHASFQPQGIIISITPQGWWPPWPEPIKKPVAVDHVALGLSPIVAPQPYGAQGYEYAADLFGSPNQKPNVSLLQFDHLPPPPFPPVPQGWRPDYPNLIKPPLSAAQQQHTTFQPQGTIVSITPQGWTGFFDAGKPKSAPLRDHATFVPFTFVVQPQGAAGFFDAIRVQPVGADTQMPHQTQVVPPRPTPQGWLPSFDMPRPAPGKAVQPFSWDGSIPQPFVVTVSTGFLGPFSEPSARKPAKWDYSVLGSVTVAVQPYGAQGYDWAPEQVGTPQQRPSVSGQQWTGFQPIGNVPTAPTPQGWWQPFDVRIVPPFKASLQQFDRSPTDKFIPGVPTQAFLGHWAFFDSARVPPVKASLQQHGAFQPRGTIVSITPQGFWPQSASERFVRPLSAAQQQYEAVRMPPQPVATMATGYSSEIFIYTVVAETDFQAPPQPSAPAAFPEGWRPDYPNLTTKPLSASQQQHGAFQPLGAVFSITPEGWWPTYPELYARKMPVQAQAWTGYNPFFPPLGAQTPAFIGHWAFFDSAKIPPVSASIQQHGAFQPRGTVVSFTPQGFWPQQASERFVRPLPASQQQWTGYQAALPFTLSPWGWTASHDPVVIKPLAAAIQRFGDFQPFGAAIVVPRFGWWQPFPNLLRTPMPSALQQFEAHTFFQVPTKVTPQGWWQPLSIATVRPLPSSMQAWTGYQTIGPVPITARIIGQPVLLGSKASTNLKGTDAQAQLKGSKSRTNLKGKVD